MAEAVGGAGATPETGARIGYAGRSGLVGLLSKNFFLTLLTVGFYRFWAATKLRRYLWSNIRIDGDSLEYTGTGRELFLGFLIAMAILAPLSIAYVVSYRLALGSPMLAGSLQAGYFLAFFVFLQVAFFRARRYRLSRTVWRGIYASQSGSTWHYLGLFLGYGLVTVITLGFALPWMQVALQRYKLNNTWFGDHELHIEARGRDLFPRWLLVMLLVVVPLALAILPNLSALLHPVYVDLPMPSGAKPPPGGAPKMLFLPHRGAIAFLLLWLFAGLAFVWYRIAAFRYLASRLRLGDMRLHSAARGLSAVGQVLLFGLGMVGIAMVMMLVFVMFSAGAAPFVRLGASSQAVPAQTYMMVGIAMIVPLYLLFFYLLRITSYCWLWIPILRHLATTLEIENFADVQRIAQSTRPRQKLGIADSFELGAI